ncbi:RHS repeat-associated core domain-containing protein [Flavobacterium psychrophilum]|nr:RHS repeat-associated core domain-containing protein [Flavobacterium psychrophilum]
MSTLNGQISQHVEYIAFGEVLFEEHSSSFKSPYLFNGKELDRETNLTNFGARYLDMKTSLWLNVDPLAEKMPGVSPYAYCLNNPMNMVDPDGRYPYPISIRSFAPFQYFGGYFHGDGENRGFTTSATATSRVQQTFTADPTAGTMSGVKTWSDPSSHPVLGSSTATPSGGVSDFKQTANKDGSNTVTFNSTMSGANPLVPGSPDIDVKTSFSLTENTKAGTLNVNISQTGDRFPAAETFIKDTGGNPLFMGVSPYEGNPYTSLPGDNSRQMMSNSFTVNMDGKGVFTGVTQGNQTYTIGEWNKLYQNVNTQKPEVKSFGGGGGFSGCGAGGGW